MFGGSLSRVLEDGSTGAQCPVTANFTVGREKDSDLRIKVTSVSRKHAKIMMDENGKVAADTTYLAQLLTSLIFPTFSSSSYFLLPLSRLHYLSSDIPSFHPLLLSVHRSLPFSSRSFCFFPALPLILPFSLSSIPSLKG